MPQRRQALVLGPDDLSPPLDGILEEVTSAQRGEQALDHPVLEFVGPEAVLIALLRSVAVPREAHVAGVPVRVPLRGRPDEALPALLAHEEPVSR